VRDGRLSHWVGLVVTLFHDRGQLVTGRPVMGRRAKRPMKRRALTRKCQRSTHPVQFDSGDCDVGMRTRLTVRTLENEAEQLASTHLESPATFLDDSRVVAIVGPEVLQHGIDLTVSAPAQEMHQSRCRNGARQAPTV
jgi:hypothetical protein